MALSASTLDDLNGLLMEWNKRTMTTKECSTTTTDCNDQTAELTTTIIYITCNYTRTKLSHEFYYGAYLFPAV
jgi:hypothetical protein